MTEATTDAGAKAATRTQLRARLQRIYDGVPGVEVDDALAKLEALIARHKALLPQGESRLWGPEDVVLITYGDQVQREGESPLASLDEFLRSDGWADRLSAVHILPFAPSSSDDGFSVVDYRAVDPALGSWEDVAALGRNFHLMFDLVLNHCSAQSAWFTAFCRREPPYDHFFLDVEGDPDLSEVVRPRSLPLLTEVDTDAGPRRVWTTFSADQVDLNYAAPVVLLQMIDVLLEYVARGADVIRLDAIAFLWKEPGTPCIHLPQTHEAVKLIRDVLEIAAPHVWLITETNVPHAENVSYFGAGDEAHLVYQFALPPLLFDAFTHGDAHYFMKWLAELESPLPGTTFFNFTASHDGIGVRPLEGLVPPERLEAVVRAVERRGGLVSTRRRGDQDVPYELNIAYVDALQPDEPGDLELHARRFLATQAIMLALQGVPAPYFHSLVGTRNDRAAADASGHPRRINRRKFAWDQLQTQISSPESLAARIHQGYARLLELRRLQGAFHPDGVQIALAADNPALICFERRSPQGDQTILVVANAGSHEVRFDPAALAGQPLQADLISGAEIDDAGQFLLQPGQAAWLST